MRDFVRDTANSPFVNHKGKDVNSLIDSLVYGTSEASWGMRKLTKEG